MIPLNEFPVPANNLRFGLYYFPDTLHYRLSDGKTWLPAVQALGGTWLHLLSPVNRAIPEEFLAGWLEAGIEPVITIPASLDQPPSVSDFSLLAETYARWGVRYLSVFDRPNLRSSWQASAWAQIDLVERFLDVYLPLAEATVQAGLWPVFPALEPGGDYWDTAFLRTALQGMKRRQARPLERLALGAYAWADAHPLAWGQGGPERWPGAQPYFTPAGEQDQRGFRIFDWYAAIAAAVLGEPRPVIGLAGGSRQPQPEKILAAARLLAGETLPDLDPLPAAALACHFWLLSAAPGSKHSAETFYSPEGVESETAEALRQWAGARRAGPSPAGAGKRLPGQKTSPAADPAPAGSPARFIDHYLLLPRYEWGLADWHLEVIRPFVKKFAPTVGFSLAEAHYAARVTVLGGEGSFPETALNDLRAAGCRVERIHGDGTTIATLLSAL